MFLEQPLEMVAAIMHSLDHSRDAYHFAQCRKAWYHYFKEVELPRRVTKMQKEEAYFKNRVEGRDPVFLWTTMEEEMRVWEWKDTFPKKVYVLGEMLKYAKRESIQSFIESHPPDWSHIPTHIWLNGSSRYIARRTHPDPDLLRWWLSYCASSRQYERIAGIILSECSDNPFVGLIRPIFALEESTFRHYYPILLDMRETFDIEEARFWRIALLGASQHSIPRMQLCLDRLHREDTPPRIWERAARVNLCHIVVPENNPDERVAKERALYFLDALPRHIISPCATETLYDGWVLALQHAFCRGEPLLIHALFDYVWDAEEGKTLFQIYPGGRCDRAFRWILYLLQRSSSAADKEKRKKSVNLCLKILEERGIQIEWIQVLTWSLQDRFTRWLSRALPYLLQEMGDISEEDQSILEEKMAALRITQYTVTIQELLPF